VKTISDYIQVTTTTGSREEADRIARSLVEQRLAACVQIVGPITSVYRWEGRIQTSPEWQCLIKSRQTLWEPLLAAIRRLHSYQVPEILVLSIIAGNEDYLAWLAAETQRP
jgi:periplasmic divalent cation tolerance protein